MRCVCHAWGLSMGGRFPTAKAGAFGFVAAVAAFSSPVRAEAHTWPLDNPCTGPYCQDLPNNDHLNTGGGPWGACNTYKIHRTYLLPFNYPRYGRAYTPGTGDSDCTTRGAHLYTISTNPVAAPDQHSYQEWPWKYSTGDPYVDGKAGQAAVDMWYTEHYFWSNSHNPSPTIQQWKG